MNINGATRAIISHFGTGKSVVLAGASGIGKTDMARNVTNIMSSKLGKKVGNVYVLVPNLYGPDVMGQLYRSEDTRGDQVSRYTKPYIITAVEETGADLGIVLLDEFFSGGQDEQKALAQLLLEGRIGEFFLPPNWMVVACTNRLSDATGVNKPLPHVVNRVCWINVEATLDDWVHWAETMGNVHHVAVSYAKQFPGSVFHNTTGTKDKKSDMPQFCTPRKLVDAAAWLEKVSPDKDRLLHDGWATEVVTGHIGIAAGTQFMAHIKNYGLLPTWDDIVADPTNTKIPEQDRPDLQISITHMLAHRVEKESAQAAFTYLMRLPREMQVAGVMSCMKKAPEVVKQPAFADWIGKNYELVLSATSS